MSQTNTAAGPPLQSRMGTLMVIPWAGADDDGVDMPFLMAYSLGDGPAGPEAGQEAVLAAAAEVGLPVGGAILDLAEAQRNDVRLLVEAGKAVLTMPYLKVTCPVPEQWTAAARARGSVYFILASRPWPGAVAGAPVSEEQLRAFASDESVLRTAAHVLVPVGSIRR
ncbi:DUF5949 family protein [Actinacidiphila yeochonensis]|uniref:DUF5949 family protein n=1 Tax=Actinacidiphila yeochonensis TaxID=89050 RepID=UPI000569978A|nr:DUF5949 family protein [Actinacidiphila yeochonensis]